MARITRQSVELPNDRRARDAVVTIGIGLVLIFALIGLVSAGIFLGGKLSSGSKSPTRPSQTTGSRLAAQNLARARAQATAIVQTAQRTGHTIVTRETVRARHQSAAILAAARRKAATTQASGPVPPSTSGSGASTGASTSAPAPAAVGGVTSQTQATTASRTTRGRATLISPSPASARSNLSGLPTSWLVVGYNPTFGSGPGSAGSVTVTNRSNKVFSGVAHVMYARGKSATAAFEGLAPGQTAVLPLNGPVYAGGGYHIVVHVS